MNDGKDTEYDDLMKKVDDHLAKDDLERHVENLPLRMGVLMPKPPIWLFIIIVCFFAGVGYLFTHFEVWLP